MSSRHMISNPIHCQIAPYAALPLLHYFQLSFQIRIMFLFLYDLQQLMNVIIQGQDLIIANVGDSRAILATRDMDNVLTPIQLTVDLKPNLPSITLSPMSLADTHWKYPQELSRGPFFFFIF